MTHENFTWETTFDPSKDLMIHTMTDRVSVVSNLRTGVVKVLKDGNVIDTFENALISEYEKFMSGIAKSARDLAKLTPKE